jgi:histone H3/H4
MDDNVEEVEVVVDDADSVEEAEGVVAAAEDNDDNNDDDDDDDEGDEAVAVDVVELSGKPGEYDDDDDDEQDEDSLMDAEDPTEHTENVNEEDDELLSQGTEGDAGSHASPKPPTGITPKKRSPARASATGSTAKKSRTPSVKGLTIPFRTVKKAMKLDPDIPIVQNEAAIMTTMAAELFLKSLAKQSHRNAKNRGRNTIRYEDVAEARTNDASLAFLETLLP